MKKLISALFLVILFTVKIFLYPCLAYAADNGIVLDGYFDDWADKPEVQSKFSKDPHNRHIIKWYVDDKNVYLYIEGAIKGQGNAIQCSVNNGQQKVLHIKTNNPGSGRVSITDGAKILSNDGWIVWGNSSDGLSDEAEFRIPITAFQNNSSQNMLAISMKFPNFEQQYLEIKAGSTNPYLGVAICSVPMILGCFIYFKKKEII